MSVQSSNEKQNIVASLCEKYLQKLVNYYKQHGDMNGNADSNETSSTIYSAEIQLWNQLKKYVDTNESNLVNCIHGFYVYILQVFYSLIKVPAMDGYFVRSREKTKDGFKESDKSLLYNIYSRLGDLNRSLKSLKVARFYYLQACEINPNRGQAYNQLSLVTTTQVFNSLYYSVRALMATEEPISSAKNSIDSLVNKCQLMNPNIEPLFINDESKIDSERVENWLHFIIVTVYCDKLKIVLPHMFKEIDKQLQVESKNTFETIVMPKCDPKWIFASLDVAIDTLLVQAFDEKLNSFEFEKEMIELKGKFSTIMGDQTKLTPNKDNGLALKHDYLLYGFAPLNDNHKLLDFNVDPPMDQENMKQLIVRICEKLDKLIALLAEKKAKSRAKKSRNMVLQSILGSKGSS